MKPTELVPSEKLRALSAKSDARGWLQAGGHLGALGLCTMALIQTRGQPWSIPLFAVQGILFAFLYAGVHELSHRTVFKTRRLNDLFGALFGFLILVPRDFDRYEHLQHHRFTQDPDRDSDLTDKRPYTLLNYLLYFSGVLYWKYRIATLVSTAIGGHRPTYMTADQLRQVRSEARTYLAGYAVIAAVSAYFKSDVALYYWLAPLVTMKWVHLLQNLAEHVGMPYVDDLWQNTRTIHTNPVMRWLAWNMPYHTAHHIFPGVPFHALPRLHREMVAHAGTSPETVSYLGFQWHVLRKLWQEGHTRHTGRAVSTY